MLSLLYSTYSAFSSPSGESPARMGISRYSRCPFMDAKGFAFFRLRYMRAGACAKAQRRATMRIGPDAPSITFRPPQMWPICKDRDTLCEPSLFLGRLSCRLLPDLKDGKPINGAMPFASVPPPESENADYVAAFSIAPG
jgi:hypothetical protein